MESGLEKEQRIEILPSLIKVRDFKKAIHYHELHLDVVKQVGDRSGQGKAYGSLADNYRHLGDFIKAKNYLELELDISKEVCNKKGEGRANGRLGNMYYNT